MRGVAERWGCKQRTPADFRDACLLDNSAKRALAGNILCVDPNVGFRSDRQLATDDTGVDRTSALGRSIIRIPFVALLVRFPVFVVTNVGFGVFEFYFGVRTVDNSRDVQIRLSG